MIIPLNILQEISDTPFIECLVVLVIEAIPGIGTVIILNVSVIIFFKLVVFFTVTSLISNGDLFQFVPVYKSSVPYQFTHRIIEGLLTSFGRNGRQAEVFERGSQVVES